MDDAQDIRPMGGQLDVPIYQVDAFAGRLFAGNPAAVCPLEKWLPDNVMQAIAAENNLAETAFFVRIGDDYELRWFTPVVEVDLCGHATLASGYVIMTKLAPQKASTRFHTRSGILNVTRDGARFALDLPSQPPKPAEMPERFLAALGKPPKQVLAAVKYMVVYETAEEVAALTPDLAVLKDIDKDGVIVTAPGAAGGAAACDFVSRYFAPHAGIPEDPVTGSAHCALVPYWAHRLGKTKLHARQISARGGELFCEDQGRRVSLAGSAVLYLEGRIRV
ncbi:MAG: PhzF family phenazine biosynthesis protein [Dongiaceae bacterium]